MTTAKPPTTLIDQSAHDRSTTPSPYVGGRPYNSAEQDRFHSREVEKQRLAEIVDESAITVVLAGSGVGKTSLLQAGLIPRFGIRIGVLRDWTGIDPDHPYESALKAAFPHFFHDTEVEGLWPTIELIERRVRGSFVVVFDQFESLLRYSPRSATALLTAIGREVNEHDVPIRHVFSLRSEYRQKLRPLERLTPVSVVEIDPLTPEALNDSLAKLGSTGEPRVARKVSDLLMEIVARADEDDDLAASVTDLSDRSGAEVAIGALHLQVLHESMWCAVQQREPSVGEIDEATAYDGLRSLDSVGELPEAVEDLLNQPKNCLRLIHLAFSAAIDRSLDAGGLDAQSRMIVAAIGQKLSVQGYKLPRKITKLREAVFEDELMLLGDGLFVSATPSPGSDSDSLPVFSRGRDPRNGWASALSVNEIGQRLESAFDGLIRCLQASQILRKYEQPGDVDPILELVHDGWGRPFERWSKLQLLDPRWNVARAIATLGEDIEGDLTPSTLGLDDGPPGRDASDGHAGTLPEVREIRWKGCWLHNYEGRRLLVGGLRFVDCDFRGTGFEQVDFDDVEFVNCNFEGTLFNECLFRRVRFVESSGGARGADPAMLSAMIVKRARLQPDVDAPAVAFIGESSAPVRLLGVQLDVAEVDAPEGTVGIRIQDAQARQLLIAAGAVQDDDDASMMTAVSATNTLEIDVASSSLSQLSLEGAASVNVRDDSSIQHGLAKAGRDVDERPHFRLDASSTVDVAQVGTGASARLGT